MLAGYKTYIVAALIGLLSTAHSLNWLTTDTYMTLLGLLNGLGVATLRAGSKTDASVVKDQVAYSTNSPKLPTP